ncbi:hypothetical protein E1295_33210 [Nonomuraea mesophila]|uniref:Uncharacterized protein n=1 Tax=Nonomuraea mesophila TaxID=2530382 RepID=A0A4V2Z839_9ACTN|nr:hypothetical protein [Nonomuraea mesophila]TDE38816.1 hypothetical protein E1295_33210 [Nonomuraea mesophila]
MNRTGLLGAVVAVGIGLMAIALLGDWPVWLRLLLLVALAICAVAVWLVVPHSAPRYRAEEIDEPPTYHRTSTGEVLLPSTAAGYTFRFSATVQWSSTSASYHSNLSVLAVDAIISRARSIVLREPPALVSLLSKQLDAALSVPRLDSSGQVEAVAGEVTLALPDEDVKRLDRIAELRKQEELWENERRYQKNLRKYLGEDVFKSPGSAVIWWLATKEDRLKEAESLIGTLTRLSAAANDEKAVIEEFLPRQNGEVFREPEPNPIEEASGCLRRLMERIDLPPDSDQGIQFVHRVANDMTAASRPEHAQTILREFGIEFNYSDTAPLNEDSEPEGEP